MENKAKLITSVGGGLCILCFLFFYDFYMNNMIYFVYAMIIVFIIAWLVEKQTKVNKPMTTSENLKDIEEKQKNVFEKGMSNYNNENLKRDKLVLYGSLIIKSDIEKLTESEKKILLYLLEDEDVLNFRK